MLSRSTALMGTGLAALLAILTGYFSVPSLVRISIGILIVFFLPGFALVCATRPKLSLGLSEALLASVGISLAVTVCTAVLLAATPIGLSRPSLAAALGGVTLVASTYSWLRMR